MGVLIYSSIFALMLCTLYGENSEVLMQKVFEVENIEFLLTSAGNISSRILPPKKELKIGQKNPKNRRISRCASSSKSYPYNHYVDKLIWDSVSKYFLPEDHPMKERLDTIFHGKERVILNEKSLKKAGFKILHRRPWSKMTIASHRNLEGYFVKLYTDEDQGVLDWVKWKERVKGAQSSSLCITKNGWCTFFKVPKKWIYPLPANPPISHEFKRKNFILLVEDAELISEEANHKKWESKEISEGCLYALYWLLKKEGLRDSVYPSNLPFSKDGRIVLIDTEFHHEWPIPFARFTKYLSPQNQLYWSHLIENEGQINHKAISNFEALKKL